MKDGNHPQIARTPEQQPKEQAYRENAHEHRESRVSVREVVKVQRTKGVKRIADKNPAEGAPPSHKFRLQNAAIYHFLIETPEKVREENCPRAAQEVRLGKDYPQPIGEEDRKNDVRNEEDLNKVGLLGRTPFTPPVKTDLGQLQPRNKPDQQQGKAQQDRYSEPYRRKGEVEPAKEREPGTNDSFKCEED
jgi:hypothetical protein